MRFAYLNIWADKLASADILHGTLAGEVNNDVGSN